MSTNVRSYVLSDVPQTYNEAKSMCQEIGGQLAQQTNIQGDLDVILHNACASIMDFSGFWTKQGENKSNVCQVTQSGTKLQCTKENKRLEFPYLCEITDTGYDTAIERCTLLYPQTTEVTTLNVSTPASNSTIIEGMNPESSTNTGAIVGAVLCVVVVILAVTAVGFLFVKKRRKKENPPVRTESIKYEGTLQPEQQYYNTDETSYTPLRHDQASLYYSEADYESTDDTSAISKRNGSVENILKKQGIKPGNLGSSGDHEYITVMDSSGKSAIYDGEVYDLAKPVEENAKFPKGDVYDVAKPVPETSAEGKGYTGSNKTEKSEGNSKPKHFQKNVNKPKIKDRQGKGQGHKSKRGKAETDDKNLRDGEIRRVGSKIRHFNKLFS